MRSFLRFDMVYFIWTVLLVIVEILIASLAHDQFVRPYLGDLLVVILMYCFVKSFLETPVFPTAIAVLVFACFIEFLQYLQIVDKLGLQDSVMARTIIGTSFEWIDLIAYTLGIFIVLYLEKFFLKRRISVDTRKNYKITSNEKRL